jgi:N-dimethylarginine dimethylaminohydrolase
VVTGGVGGAIVDHAREDTGSPLTVQSDVAPLRRVLMKRARDAFVGPARIAEQWRALDYAAPPDFDEACRESDALAALVESLGVEVCWLPPADAGLDSIYVRDAAVASDAGIVLGRMGKPARAGEPSWIGSAAPGLGLSVLGRIEAPGTLEGGDVVWLDRRTLAVGRGKRTNAEGIRQLAALLPDVDVLTVPLPDWSAPGDVFHLMSGFSPVADDLALVVPRLLPGAFLDRLRARGYELVEVPAPEVETIGPNVLAVAPRSVVALEGSPETRRLLERAGAAVHIYRGEEISRKGFGGPTCLTRPLLREG